MNAREVLGYYSNRLVLEQMLSYAKDREISVALREGGHMPRPRTVTYARDILELAKKGGVSFHGTAEHWKNPLLIRTGMSKEDLGALRNGWDLIIDIDSSIGLDASKIAALRVLDFLHKHGIDAGIKFSGNRGFHIGVPWSSVPSQVGEETASIQFPRLPLAIVSYIKASIKDDLFDDLKKRSGSVHELMEELDDPNIPTLSPYHFVDIENNWGERHLFRLPYSLNEKSWLVSVPLSRNEMERFKMEHASAERVLRYKPQEFLPNTGSIDVLLDEAVRWNILPEDQRTEKSFSERFDIYTTQPKTKRQRRPQAAREIREVPIEAFPPCVKLIADGLADGRKRAILVLVNFLQQMNWPWEKIEAAVREANSKNRPPLPETYVNAQLNWFKRSIEAGRSLLPPNCSNETFYRSFNICQPDERCKRGTQEIQIKNPVSYPFSLPLTKRKL